VLSLKPRVCRSALPPPHRPHKLENHCSGRVYNFEMHDLVVFWQCGMAGGESEKRRAQMWVKLKIIVWNSAPPLCLGVQRSETKRTPEARGRMNTRNYKNEADGGEP
jgi:hypothetical protein